MTDVASALRITRYSNGGSKAYADLATEYLDLKDRARVLDDRIKQIVAQLRDELGAGKPDLCDKPGYIEIADHYGDDWDHHSGCQGDPGDSGCPLCRILHATRPKGQR